MRTILGIVTDDSDAVVANASVEAVNLATRVIAHTQTSSTGDFTIPYLKPGIYKVPFPNAWPDPVLGELFTSGASYSVPPLSAEVRPYSSSMTPVQGTAELQKPSR